MDLNLARTFLAIVEAGSFVTASHRLHVTQSTVSARIRTLESLIGKPLLVRNNTTCELTSAGRRFDRYARSLIRVWQEARHEIAVPENFMDTLALGGQSSLWEGYLFDWLMRCRAELPKTALRATAGVPRRLLEELLDGVLDIIVVHSPELRAGLQIEELFEDHLTLVSTSSTQDFRDRYVFFDWGDAFRAMHADAFPEIHSPGLALEIGALGVKVLLTHGGAGYLPERLVRGHLECGDLHRVPDAPVFLYPAFAVYQQENAARPSLQRSLQLLREVAGKY